MHAHDCSHTRGSGQGRRHVQATALVQRPRRGIEWACPLPDGRLARLVAGDERVRTEALLWAYAAAIPLVLVLVAVTALAGPAAGAVVILLAGGAAGLAVVATVAAARRFVIFSTGSTDPDDVDQLERCAGSLAATTAHLGLLGEEAGPTEGAVVHAMGAARRRLDAARQAEQAAQVLLGADAWGPLSPPPVASQPGSPAANAALAVGDASPLPTPGDPTEGVVALALADARALAAAHRLAAAEHLRAAHDVLRAARALGSARADEHRRAAVLLGDPTPVGGPQGSPADPSGRYDLGDQAVVADLDELAARARAQQVATDLTLRAEALAALG